ncbi:hypothetical protein F4775DRAFT_546556 [Biscogniauxia sp. FL1348]|nr:hypothetical protein F4775DRAFT_546556 [Biscogniauxia sp. FL1348]
MFTELVLNLRIHIHFGLFLETSAILLCSCLGRVSVPTLPFTYLILVLMGRGVVWYGAVWWCKFVSHSR